MHIALPAIGTMTTTTTTSTKASTEQKHFPEVKQGTTKNWLARHLRKQVSKQAKDNGYLERKEMDSLARPQTAPLACIAKRQPTFSTTPEPPLARPLNKPPPRPPRPDSNVIRDVNAWLEASIIKPAPKLMGGLSYWREGGFTGASPSSDVRYAVPIVHTHEIERPDRYRGQRVKSFRLRAKKMQVWMPSPMRTRSHRVTRTPRKQANCQSSSESFLSIPAATIPAPIPWPLIRPRSLGNLADQSGFARDSGRSIGWIRPARGPFIDQAQRLKSAASVRFDEPETNLERHVNAVFSRSSRFDGTSRSASSGGITREESVTNLSDAPTYFSGPPPPSYRSRAASILTTSSFGCIDGMDSERRQLSKQRTAQRARGVKGKFKKLGMKLISQSEQYCTIVDRG